MHQPLTINTRPATAPQSGLESLPSDVLLDITEKFTTARDLASLGSVSRRLHGFTQDAGWRTFCRSSFSPVLDAAAGRMATQQQRWDAVADRLTYLDRCWERRAFDIWKYHDDHGAGGGGGRRAGRGRGGGGPRRGQSGMQNVSFHPVLDARALSGGDAASEGGADMELVAWGAGEDVITKLKPLYSAGQESWFRLRGSESGYTSGFGDVTALSIIERSGTPELVVGRTNGDLKIVAAAGDEFGAVSQTLLPYRGATKTNRDVPFGRTSPARVAISWTDWQPRTNMLASCRHSSIALYNLANREEKKLEAACHYDLVKDCPSDEKPFVRSVKFFGKDVIVCALGGTRQPLKWGRMTPTGLELFEAAQHLADYAHLDDLAGGAGDKKTTVRAIEPVDYGYSESLVLSAWEDGTYRLNDVRTPSRHDAMYRDRWNVYDPGSSLLVYGSQRFVAGSNVSETLTFFDFRNPKPYHHTSALSCSGQPPRPSPPGLSSEPGSAPAAVNERCCHLLGQSCSWHLKAAQDSWRPDSMLHFGRTQCDRVHSLAKSSNLSDSFYVGVDGYVLDVNLRLAEDVDPGKRPSAPAGWACRRPNEKISLIETGVGRVRGRDWDMLATELPDLWTQYRTRSKEPRADIEGFRLDTVFQRPSNDEQ